jgi:hypothetical protein
MVLLVIPCGEKQPEGQCLFHVASDSQEKPAPSMPVQVPSNFTSERSQAKKDRHAEKEYLKQMSELANIVQQQHLENRTSEKLFWIPRSNHFNFP